MSLQNDRIPFYIQDGDETRIATQDEFDRFKNDPRNKAMMTKWTKANRIAEAKYHMFNGDDKAYAWAKAFERYPDCEPKRHRFFIKK